MPATLSSMPAAALAWALILAAMLPTPIYSAGTKITRFSAAKFVQRWTCPAHVKEIEVAMWGAAGGSTSASTRGGAGGFATGKITVSPGKSYSIVVGGCGKQGTYSLSAGGGGATALFRNYPSQGKSYALMVAGGGGGAGVAAFGNSGGNGGGSSGSRGQSSSNGGYGGTRTKGGTSIADGSPSSCLGSRSGNYMRGGHGSGCRKVGDGGYGGGGNAGGLTGYDGGGGGGGYYGGGGGATLANSGSRRAGGGGGGSSYYTSSYVKEGRVEKSYGSSAPMTSHPDYRGQAGQPNSGRTTTGCSGSGLLVIRHPDIAPSQYPTTYPTYHPTTNYPTYVPTNKPSPLPSMAPTLSAPTTSPTPSPTPNPSMAPTSPAPTVSPTTSNPTVSPTTAPPSTSPTTGAPTVAPSGMPSSAPTTATPTMSPTFTYAPSTSPTLSSNIFGILQRADAAIESVENLLPETKGAAVRELYTALSNGAFAEASIQAVDFAAVNVQLGLTADDFMRFGYNVSIPRTTSVPTGQSGSGSMAEVVGYTREDVTAILLVADQARGFGGTYAAWMNALEADTSPASIYTANELREYKYALFINAFSDSWALLNDAFIIGIAPTPGALPRDKISVYLGDSRAKYTERGVDTDSNYALSPATLLLLTTPDEQEQADADKDGVLSVVEMANLLSTGRSAAAQQMYEGRITTIFFDSNRQLKISKAILDFIADPAHDKFETAYLEISAQIAALTELKKEKAARIAETTVGEEEDGPLLLILIGAGAGFLLIVIIYIRLKRRPADAGGVRTKADQLFYDHSTYANPNFKMAPVDSSGMVRSPSVRSTHNAGSSEAEPTAWDNALSNRQDFEDDYEAESDFGDEPDAFGTLEEEEAN